MLPKPAGYVDHFDIERVAGWAVNPDGSGRTAIVSLHIDGQHVRNISADLSRMDVARTGNMPSHCGFDISLPASLRDGRAHRVELRLGANGPRLRGGRMNIPAAQTGHELDVEHSGQPLEGVAWFDRGRAAVVGWATGCGTVSISVDGAAAQDIELNREVAGFGAGNRQGFMFVVPPTLVDNHEHRIEVRAGHWGDDVPLDGSPFQVRVNATRPRVDLSLTAPRQLLVALRSRDGTPERNPVTIAINGVDLALADCTPNEVGEISLSLGEDARHLTIATRPDLISQDTPAFVIGRYVLAADGRPQDWSAEVPHTELDILPLGGELLAQARGAFDDFTQAPDHRFDAAWVATRAGLATADLALEHWKTGGAAAGLAPGPTFDEGAARALHPGVADAIAKGDLPCAFALELVLGAGALGSMTGLTTPSKAAGQNIGDTSTQGDLPPITTWCDPTQSIYAAWLRRVALSEGDVAKVDRDERASRSEVAAVTLRRQPLVSIIMPSWNRAFTIGEAIQSVIEQSYPNWELLICDDASEDRTADVVRGFEDGRIRYMRFQKSNGAGARNHGLRHAKGEYIAYLDSDNMWHPLFLDLMIRRLMGAPGVPIAYSAYLDTETQGATVLLQDIAAPPFRPVQLSGKNFMDLNTIVHHRRVLDWMGGFDGALPRLQDWDLVLRYTSIFGAMFVDRIGVFYRRNIAWGQVTHTQQASGAQDTVNAKTQARLAGGHETIHVDWPAPSRVTVLCGDGGATGTPVEAAAVATAMIRLAGKIGAVDLVSSGGCAVPDNLAMIDRRRTAPNVETLGDELADLGGAPVLVSGIDDKVLRRMHGLDPHRTYRPVSRANGTWFEPLSGAAEAFPLGALPLEGDKPQRATGVRPPKPTGPLLVFGSDSALEAPNWVSALLDAGLEALVPPTQKHPTWTRIGASGRQEIPVDDPGRLPATDDISVALVLGESLCDISPWQMGLLNLAMAEGVPVAVPADDDPESLSSQWVAAQAAYALNSRDPDWVFEKLPKLLRDRGSLVRLSEQARMVHQIVLAPELALQRTVHFLWRQQFDPLLIEVSDGA